jgi:hypothetical protein
VYYLRCACGCTCETNARDHFGARAGCGCAGAGCPCVVDSPGHATLDPTRGLGLHLAQTEVAKPIPAVPYRSRAEHRGQRVTA